MHELHSMKHIMILQYKLTKQTMVWQATVIMLSSLIKLPI